MIRMGHAHIHSESPEQNSRSIKLHSHVRPKLKLYAIDFNPFLHDHTFHLYTFAGYSTLCPLYVMSRWQIFASLCLVVLVCNAISKFHGNSCRKNESLAKICRLTVIMVNHCSPTIEPRHDKTNKVTVCPAKTQISLGIRPVWSESSLSAWRKLGSLATH